MCADLAYAHASIDWAETNLPAFQQRMQAWLNDHIDVEIRHLESDSANNLLVAVQKEPIPLAFSVEFGSYINAVRSSFDILATALAYRYGMSNKDNVHFPIAKTEAAFLAGNYKGVEFVKRLPPTERLKIEKLRPYSGGNALLWMLHHMDNTRKHRRLIETQTRPARIAYTVYDRAFMTSARADRATMPHRDGEIEIGFVSKFADKRDFKIAAEITVAEPGCLFGYGATAAIYFFVTLARDTVRLFDDP